MNGKTRILLVDDHQLNRQDLRSMLSRQPGFEVSGDGDGKHSLDLAGELQPDVVIIDMQMINFTGMDTARQINQAHPKTRIICLAAHLDDDMMQEALKAGAHGYVLKSATQEQLTEAIRTVLSGKIFLGSEVAANAANGSDGHARESDGAAHDSNGAARNHDALSRREREVVKLIAEGFATKQIAAQLQISAKTVETHRRNLMEKLKIDSVAELTKYAIREGISSL